MKYVEDLYECKDRVYCYTLLGFCWDCWLFLAPQALRSSLMTCLGQRVIYITRLAYHPSLSFQRSMILLLLCHILS